MNRIKKADKKIAGSNGYGNNKATPEKIILSAQEAEELTLRNNLINRKQAKINSLMIELNLLKSEVTMHSNKLLEEKGASTAKNWSFDSKCLIEVK